MKNEKALSKARFPPTSIQNLIVLRAVGIKQEKVFYCAYLNMVTLLVFQTPSALEKSGFNHAIPGPTIIDA